MTTLYEQFLSVGSVKSLLSGTEYLPSSFNDQHSSPKINSCSSSIECVDPFMSKGFLNKQGRA